MRQRSRRPLARRSRAGAMSQAAVRVRPSSEPPAPSSEEIMPRRNGRVMSAIRVRRIRAPSCSVDGV
jgi:hypothetical protein